MPRVVVTGAAGFIGRHVVRERVSAGWDVVAMDRRPHPRTAGVDVVVQDVVDPRSAAVLGSTDAVVHLAGAPGVRADGPGVARRRWHDNVLATAAVVDHAPPGAHVVVTSSSSIYGGAGAISAPRACREDDVPRPRGGYAHSKVVAERLAARRRGPTTVVRPFTVAGEGQRADMALATWLAAARAGRDLRVLGDLRRRRDVSDVREVAAAVGRLLDAVRTGTFNLGSGVTHSLAEHLEAVRAVTGGDLRVRVEPAHDREVPTTWADTTALAHAVGALARTPLATLVARQDAAARRHPTDTRTAAFA